MISQFKFIIAISCLLFALSLASSVKAEECRGFYTISSPWINVRSGPGLGASKVGELKKGDRVQVSSCDSGEWFKISHPSIPEGFLHRQYLNRIPTGTIRKEFQSKIINSAENILAQFETLFQTQAKKIYRVESEWIRLRSGPSAEFPEINRLYRGDVIEVSAIDQNGWAVLKGQNNKLYVHSDYLEPLKWSAHKQNYFYLFLAAITEMIPSEITRIVSAVSIDQITNSSYLPILSYRFIGDIPDAVADDPERRSNTVSAENFERHLQYLSAGQYANFNFNDLEYLIDNNSLIPSRQVTLTFLGGYRSHFAITYPLLEQYGFKGVFFVSIDYIGKPGYMDWPDLKNLLEHGHQIAALAPSAEDILKLSTDQIREKMSQAKGRLEYNLKVGINTIRYTQTAKNQDVMEAISKAGYRFGVTNYDASIFPLSDRFNLPSSQVTDQGTLTKFVY